MVILTEGQTDPHTSKTATSLVRYCRDECVALLDSTQAGKTSQALLGVGGELPIVASLNECPDGNTLVIGIAPQGGKLPAAWRRIVLEAVDRGMNVVSGLHDFLSDDAEIAAVAEAAGVTIEDVRKNNERDVATLRDHREDCLRVLTIGNDCSVGKMVTSIEITRGLIERGLDAKFLATGQTGIMIAGEGCPIDCVVADFVNGAAEKLVLANQQHSILLVEGQGSLFHPSYSAVTAGLIHGCLPQAMILCYEVGRKTIHGHDHLPLPPLSEVKQVYETLAAAMMPSQVIGIAMNSRKVSQDEAEQERERLEWEFMLPVCDVFRHGPDALVDAVATLYREHFA